MHQQKYKISSHVQAFMRQFAQWRSARQFEAAGPWKVLAKSNSKLEVQCRQADMTGAQMFQAMYILAPNAAVASVSCALPSPKSLAIGFAPPRPTSVSAGGMLSSKSKAGKLKGVDKVRCTYCKEMFGKQGIRNHEAKCAEQKYGTQPKGWQSHKYEPPSDDDDNDFDDFKHLNSGHQGSKKTTFRNIPSPSITLSAAGDAPKTPEQLLAAAQKELKALKKQQQKALQQEAKPVPQSSSDPSSSSSGSSNSSPEKKVKKSQQKKKSGRSAAELRAKAAEAAAAAAAAEAAEAVATAAAAAAAGKRKKNKKQKKQKKEKKKATQDDSPDDSPASSSDDSPASSSDGNGHRRRKKQRRKQALSANPTDANRKSQKRTSGGALGWYMESRTNQAILEERARTNQRMFQMVHNHLRNWLSDFTFGCVGTRGPRCRPSC